MSFGRRFALAFAADKEKCNKNSNNKNKSTNDDPDPNRNSCAGSFSASYFNMSKKNRRKRGYVDGSGFCGSACNKFYFNNKAFGCLICKSGKTGRVFDDKAVNAVFFNKFYVINSNFVIGFGVVKINKFTVGHVIFTAVFCNIGGVDHCENIAVIVGFCICLGSVKAVNNGAVGSAFVSHSVGKKGKIESCKSIAVGNKFCGGFVGNAVTVKRNDVDVGGSANIFFKNEFNFGYGNVAVDAESKAYGFENVLYRSFNNGRTAGGRFRFGTFGRGRAGTYRFGRTYGFGRTYRAGSRRTCGTGNRRAGRTGRAAFRGRAGRRTAGNDIVNSRTFPYCVEINSFVGCVESIAGFIGLVSILPTYKNTIFISEAGRTCNKIKRFIIIVIFGNGKSLAVSGEIGYGVSLSGGSGAAGRGRGRTGGRSCGGRRGAGRALNRLHKSFSFKNGNCSEDKHQSNNN